MGLKEHQKADYADCKKEYVRVPNASHVAIAVHNFPVVSTVLNYKQTIENIGTQSIQDLHRAYTDSPI